MPQALLSIKTVCERTSLSRTTIHRLRDNNDFPAPIKITERRIGWTEQDVNSWIENRANPQQSPAQA